MRAVVAGLLLSPIIGALGPFFSLYIRGSNTGGGFFTNPMSHFLLFLIVGLINVAIGACRRTWALRPGELVTMYILMTLGNQAINIGILIIPLLSGPYYHATPENNWETLVHPLIPYWIAPYEELGIRAFFEGTFRMEASGLWMVWVEPLLHWLPLLIAVNAAMLCMTVIIRRQWSERERIIYPLIQVAGSMIQDDERRSLVKPFFRNRIMWMGFCLPFFFGLLQALHAYFPFIPEINYRTTLPLPGGVSASLILSFVALAFFFLINLEVAFSLWMFSLLNLLQRSFYNIVGIIDKQEPILSVWNYGPPSVVHQSMGAMIALVFGGVWISREHLMNVMRKAFAGAPDVQDSDEVISYRGAVFGTIACLCVIAAWLVSSGIPPIPTLVFMFFAFVVFIALTRVVVEGGVAMLYTPLVPPDAALSALGSHYFTPQGVAALTFTRVWANDIFNFAMPHCANNLKLSERIDGDRRPLFWAMLAAMILGLAGAVCMSLYLAYTFGAINMSERHFGWFGRYVYEYAATHISTPVGPNWTGWLHTGIGALIMTALLIAQKLWVWWPLHPIGYPVSSVFSWMGYNAFIAWTLKVVVLKYGGPRLYNTVKPLFLGMIIGQFAIYGVFWIIDPLTGMVGNYLIQ